MNTRNNTRKLAFEQVENREMMAGNVQAAIYGGELVIVGDNQSNQIEVTEIGNNVVQIKATDGTTVNGTNVAYFFNPSDNINVYMNGGNDRLILESTAGRTTTFNKAYIDMGSGQDYLCVWGTAINGPATLITGADWENESDTIDMGKHPFNPTFHSANFWSSLDIKTGGGDDFVTMRENVNVYGNLSIRTGDGNDQLRMDKVLAYKDFFADLGKGDDQMNAWGLTARGSVNINAGSGGLDRYFGSLDYLNVWYGMSGFERVNRW
jgi:hypothetical protein